MKEETVLAGERGSVRSLRSTLTGGGKTIGPITRPYALERPCPFIDGPGSRAFSLATRNQP